MTSSRSSARCTFYSRSVSPTSYSQVTPKENDEDTWLLGEAPKACRAALGACASYPPRQADGPQRPIQRDLNQSRTSTELARSTAAPASSS